MLFGDPSRYAIELYHEPLNDAYTMAGRMCVYLKSIALGYLDDPGCPFWIPYHRLREIAADPPSIRGAFGALSDKQIFALLDEKLYLAEEDTTYEQIIAGSKQYNRFDFLTNCGEMFDGTKSFLYLDSTDQIHVLFQFFAEPSALHTAQIDKGFFLQTTNEFLTWYEQETGGMKR